MVLRVVLSVSAVLAAIFFFHYFAEELIEVETSIGILKGKVYESHLGTNIAVFKGIPFGKYEERFADSESFGNIHTGVYYATRDMEACTQEKIDSGLSDDLTYSETCLHLNIWIPQPMRKGREVMVYIHGGKNSHGSGSDPQYDGRILATHGDVIVVTFNYRLGVFGFYYSDVPGNTVGNVGLKDQQLALKWVHDHIADFGGDPNKVTVFGESSGAASIAYHLALPASQGLFQRAIMQSVPSLDEGFNEPETMSKASEKLHSHFNCKGQNAVACLRNVPAEDLLKSSSVTEIDWLPVIDGKFITDSPTNMLRNSNLDGVEVLIGVNKDEDSSYGEQLLGITRGKATSNVKKLFEEGCRAQVSLSPTTVSAEAVCTEYYKPKMNSSEEVVKALGEVYVDRYFVCPTDRLAQILVLHNAKVRLYHLTHREEHSQHPSPYGSDIQWVFGVPLQKSTTRKYGTSDETFSKTIMTMWIQFAKYGDPVNGSDLEWDPYTVDYPTYLELKLPQGYLHRGESIRENFCSLWS